MNLQKIVLRPGNQVNFPMAGDSVGIHYTGWLYSRGSTGHRGRE